MRRETRTLTRETRTLTRETRTLTRETRTQGWRARNLERVAFQRQQGEIGEFLDFWRQRCEVVVLEPQDLQGAEIANFRRE
jgi:very-short-patch-repair endonuclease